MPEPQAKEVEQSGPVRHLWQTRVVPHEVEPPSCVLTRWRFARIAFSRGVDRGLDDHQLVHGRGQLLVRHLGAVEIIHGTILLWALSRDRKTGAWPAASR